MLLAFPFSLTSRIPGFLMTPISLTHTPRRGVDMKTMSKEQFSRQFSVTLVVLIDVTLTSGNSGGQRLIF